MNIGSAIQRDRQVVAVRTCPARLKKQWLVMLMGVALVVMASKSILSPPSASREYLTCNMGCDKELRKRCLNNTINYSLPYRRVDVWTEERSD